MADAPGDRVIRLHAEGLGELWLTLRGLLRTPSIVGYLAAHEVYMDEIKS